MTHRIACVVVLFLSALRANSQEIVLRSGLAVGPLSRGGRYALHRDPLEQQIVLGKWAAPKMGDSVAGVEGAAGKWRAVEADKEGWFSAAGYLYAPVTIESPRIMILEAAGHGMVYVNGAPRAGDPYEYGYVHLPVALHAGANDLLFLGGRGRIRARLAPPPAPAYLDTADSTLPDLIRGQRVNTVGAVIVVNATNNPVAGLNIEAKRAGLKSTRTPVPTIPPLSTRKVAFRIAGAPASDAKEVKVSLRIAGAPASAAPTVEVPLRVREPGQTYKRTFVSEIDGSVQYFGVNPPGKRLPLPKGEKAALVLTLHGASVEGIGQADAYAPKPWAYLVAPTNRRPYGFDWEDWGRADAIEVLNLAQRELDTDPRRTYLTGHSMGGHGTWQIGVLYPDRFAAIGPSAGWISFYSYGGGQRRDNPSPVDEILLRASSASDTLALAKNYRSEGVYVLHGGADDNVPVTEARHMNTVLAGFHHDFTYFEQPGAGHWWSNTDEPGAACVDWPPMFDMFLRHELPDPLTVRDVDFSTPNPAVSASCRWLTIAQQAKPLAPSTVSIRVDPNQRRFIGTTGNVANLSLDLGMLEPGKPFSVELDMQKLADIPWPSSGSTVWLANTAGKWSVGAAPGPDQKNPNRGGTLKLAFNHRMVFVYGTAGTPDENAQCFAKARFDAESFWYRGNGSVDVVADRDFDPARFRDRSVILYGNADTNSAWPKLLASSPVQVRRGSVEIGGKKLSGGDLACLFLRPRPDSQIASVGVISGSGPAGMRLAERFPIFLSGAGFPDCLVAGSDVLTGGSSGIRAAGFFGNDWRVESGDFVWNLPQ